MKLSFPQFNAYLAGLIIAVTVAGQTPANAYETDTHFYATYAMARYAGIKHDTAAVIASSAQWPDETEVLGSPLVPDAVIGTKMRRLFHFPCDTYSPEKAASSLAVLMGKTTATVINLLTYLLGQDTREQVERWIKNVNGLCETYPVHPMAYNMLDEGLERGNLIEAATSIHTIEDSFAHAGTLSNVGHAVFGHHPDRGPNFPEKYRTMVRAVMAALVAIRANLPDDSIDHRYRDPSSKLDKANADMNIDELTEGYKNNEYVKNTYMKDPYKNPEYVKMAIEYFLKLSQDLADNGDHFIDPTFKVADWFRNNSALMTLINKGDAGTCKFPERPQYREEDPAYKPSYVDCLLTKTVLALIKYSEERHLYIVDKFRARSLVEDFGSSPISKKAKIYDDKVAALLEKIQIQGQMIGKLGKKEVSALQSHTAQISALKVQIASVRKDKRVALYDEANSIIQEDMRLSNSEPHRYIHQVAARLTASFVPKHLNEYHWMEFENEGILRQQELALRIRNMRVMIYQVYHDFVRFVVNDKVWGYPKSRALVQNLPFETSDILPLPKELGFPEELEYNNKGHQPTNVKYITFNYNQVDIWVEMAIRYMFPDVTNTLFPEDRCTLVSKITKFNPKTDGYETLQPALDIRDSNGIFWAFLEAAADPNFVGCNNALPVAHVSRLAELGMIGGPIMAMGTETYSYIQSFKKLVKTRLQLFSDDIATTHMLPDHRLQHFLEDDGIRSLYQEGRYRPFQHWGQLTARQVDKQNSYIQQCLRWSHESASDKVQFPAGYQDKMRALCIPYHGLSDEEKEAQSH